LVTLAVSLLAWLWLIALDGKLAKAEPMMLRGSVVLVAARHGPADSLPREEWISLIPDAHPGYITVEQYDANRARLAANAAAHGRDRAAGPAREGPGLLQGVIICGRCGTRMTVRYHHRRGRDVPTYMCQRDGIENGRPVCAAIPGAPCSSTPPAPGRPP
jgi:hypothetical protein